MQAGFEMEFALPFREGKVSSKKNDFVRPWVGGWGEGWGVELSQCPQPFALESEAENLSNPVH